MVVGPVNRSVAPLKMQILLKAPISDVGSGSKTVLTPLKWDVRFSPENRRVSDVVPRWAFRI
jgi:hypothetical protein